MATEDHARSVRSASVTLDAVQERIDDEVDTAILRDASSILDDYEDGLEVDDAE